MSSDLSALPLIFKENNQPMKAGLTPLPSVPSYTDQASEDVAFVCFPYRVDENIMPMKAREVQLKKIALAHKDATNEKVLELVFENIPKMLAKKYRQYLRAAFPSISEKPLIIVMTTDYSSPSLVPDDIFCIRTSLRKSSKREQDLAFPSPIPWKEYNGPLPASEISIGFCGVPNNHTARASLLKFLYESPRTKTDFIYRKTFWGRLKKNVTPEQAQRLQAEFNAILYRNIFSVSSRGLGNYSVRFYETLREGRIPVLLDSDMPFPFENNIDWESIVICEKTPEEAEAKMLDWAKNRDLVAIQNQCRKIWEEYLYIPAFLEKLPTQLITN